MTGPVGSGPQAEVDLGELVVRRVALLAPWATERGVAVGTDGTALARVDPDAIARAVDNLLRNAWKFTSRTAQPKIEVGAAGDVETVIFVRDNGAGFDMRFSARLFGAFQRLHDVREFDGTGIGLAIVRRIVQRHGGEVWAEGVQNQGATFYFSLPKTTARPAES